MYRYSVDDAITYTSEDVVLFKESPFACWMERLTLENPGHGIPADADSRPPHDSMSPQDELAYTLLGEGKDVAVIAWEQDESRRRKETLDAMRAGVDFIVDGQLALGPLSGSANLLMRTSGYSRFGDYLYVPCNTQPKTNLHAALRLCFLADLLDMLQGQLPPRMLIIRGGDDVVPLHTEDHIYHYRAVKKRFMNAQAAFRKHKMPDPAASSHFGRWSDCANEVLKQRAVQSQESDEALPELEEEFELPRVAGEPLAPTLAQAEGTINYAATKGLKPSGATLAEQARHIAVTPALETAVPPVARPGATILSTNTPTTVAAPATVPEPSKFGPMVTEFEGPLENLSFIGSSDDAGVLDTLSGDASDDSRASRDDAWLITGEYFDDGAGRGVDETQDPAAESAPDVASPFFVERRAAEVKIRAIEQLQGYTGTEPAGAGLDKEPEVPAGHPLDSPGFVRAGEASTTIERVVDDSPAVPPAASSPAQSLIDLDSAVIPSVKCKPTDEQPADLQVGSPGRPHENEPARPVEPPPASLGVWDDILGEVGTRKEQSKGVESPKANKDTPAAFNNSLITGPDYPEPE